MTKPRVIFSELAVADILEQADWYEAKGNERLTKRWDKAVNNAILRICRAPENGSPCPFETDNLKGTRRIPIEGFPKHLIFYRLRDGEVLILRVLHGARDLGTLFSD